MTAFSGALITPFATARVTAPAASTTPAARRDVRGAAAYRTRTCVSSVRVTRSKDVLIPYY